MKKIKLTKGWKAAFIHNSDMPAEPYTSREDMLCAGVTLYETEIPTANELVLMENGVLPDIFFGTNIEKAYKYEYYHAFYSVKFNWDGGPARIRFEGVDTSAEYFLDGMWLGSSENMFLAPEFVTQLWEGEHELTVHILPAVLVSRQREAHMGDTAMVPDTDALYIRKAAYMFGWDIFPRVVSGGIYRDVYVEEIPDISIKQAYVYTLAVNGTEADINCYYDIDFGTYEYAGCRIVMEGACGDSSFSASRLLFARSGTQRLHLTDARLWYPLGRGGQDMYDISFRVEKEGRVLAEKKFRTGIRTSELCRGSLEGEDFRFIINNEPTFILGTNFVPLDSFPCKGKEKIPEFINMCRELNINMIRIWGGGFYPDDSLYELCDENGIMIWHDFMMGCGTYPQDFATQSSLEDETRYNVRRLRHHPSIVLWSGDNECDNACAWTFGNKMDPNDNVLTRKIIPAVLRDEDCIRPYLPSSPYVDEKAFRTGLPTSEDHLWGPRDYFKGPYYVGAKCAFASETGYHGCPYPESLAKFISKENLWPYKNDEWTYHQTAYTAEEFTMFSYRNDLMAGQVRTLFGYIPDGIEEFSRLSQYSQGEALKFFIERFRYAKWKRTGIIWWNLLDGAPQISDAVVDYYMNKKRAYEYIKRSEAPVCMMFGENEEGKCTLYAVNDTKEDKELEYTVTELVSGRVLCRGKCIARADSCIEADSVPYPEEFEFWLIEFSGGKNHFIPTPPPYGARDYEKYISRLD